MKTKRKRIISKEAIINKFFNDEKLGKIEELNKEIKYKEKYIKLLERGKNTGKKMVCKHRWRVGSFIGGLEKGKIIKKGINIWCEKCSEKIEANLKTFK